MPDFVVRVKQSCAPAEHLHEEQHRNQEPQQPRARPRRFPVRSGVVATHTREGVARRSGRPQGPVIPVFLRVRLSWATRPRYGPPSDPQPSTGRQSGHRDRTPSSELRLLPTTCGCLPGRRGGSAVATAWAAVADRSARACAAHETVRLRCSAPVPWDAPFQVVRPVVRYVAVLVMRNVLG